MGDVPKETTKDETAETSKDETADDSLSITQSRRGRMTTLE